jgi:signal transduction histidine kinase
MRYSSKSLSRARFKPSITFKLLLWSFALIFIFLLTTTFILTQIQNIVKKSNNIVTVHYNVIDRSDKLIENLLTLLEYKKKYQILNKEEYREDYRTSFASFQADFQDYFAMTSVSSMYEDLPKDRRANLQALGSANGSGFLDDELMTSWIDTLSAIRRKHRTAVMSELRELRDEGNSAVQTGFLGLSASFLAGVTGSLLLAFFINRSAKELKRGIQRVGQNGDYQPVRVLSRDEMGELAEVFNEMSQRLRQEDERRSDFISMLSHEIRTPLTSIKECLSMLRDGTTGSVSREQMHLLDVSHQEVDRLTAQLDRLMYVSSLESRSIQLQPEPLRAEGLISKSLSRIRPLARRKGIALEEDVDREMEVQADGEHIQQVIINLVANAVKFSPESSTVKLRARPGRDRHTAVFAVEDEGPGISASEQSYIFDKYFRATASKDKVDGAGLGLHISKRIIGEHGGKMWVENRNQGGSVFYFTLSRAATSGQEQ